MKVVDENSIEAGNFSQYIDVSSRWYTLLSVYQMVTTMLALFGNTAVLFLSHRLLFTRGLFL